MPCKLRAIHNEKLPAMSFMFLLVNERHTERER